MKKPFQTILRALIDNSRGGPIAGIPIADQFVGERTGREAGWKNLNALFLMALAGQSHSRNPPFSRLADSMERDPVFAKAVAFYRAGLSAIPKEMEERCKASPAFQEKVNRLARWLQDGKGRADRLDAVDRVWNVFFPEGVSLFQHTEEAIRSLRRRRQVRVTRLNPEPIQDPAGEVLFTSNVLLTTPPADAAPGGIRLSSALQERLPEIIREPQCYWYDHPIPVGQDPARNEVLHGLVGLDQAISFEKARGRTKKDARVACLLSISCTHHGLQEISRAYLEETLGAVTDIRHLDIYAVTEADVHRLIHDVLTPAERTYLGSDRGEILGEVLGVDGEYGRHYSFLKAMAAFWQVFVDSQVRATFKIDLDQIFPQQELVRETRHSAFDHLTSPLWGAEGVDWQGNPVHLGMIAGALVNENDIGQSVYTPDVSVPNRPIHGDEWIFFSRLPQTVSTHAEMMTQYGDQVLDGQHTCIQRVHVTGGTCGILVESLRRYRPFTPGFVGRAEDQAYLLSVSFSGEGSHLRYVHKDGLIMRHDKETFAGGAIRGAAGKLVGDYLRILVFSNYANALPWTVEKVKGLIDPYTGCFVSPIPITVVYLRLGLKAASLFQEGKDHEARELLEMGTDRLWRVIRTWEDQPSRLKEMYVLEKEGWDAFYDIVNSVEAAAASGDSFALRLIDRARELLDACKIRLRSAHP